MPGGVSTQARGDCPDCGGAREHATDSECLRAIAARVAALEQAWPELTGRVKLLENATEPTYQNPPAPAAPEAKAQCVGTCAPDLECARVPHPERLCAGDGWKCDGTGPAHQPPRVTREELAEALRRARGWLPIMVSYGNVTAKDDLAKFDAILARLDAEASHAR